MAEQWARRSLDNDADGCAMRFTEHLERAVLTLEARDPGFDLAARKADHVEELRRVLGVLLDILADWELIADRSG